MTTSRERAKSASYQAQKDSRNNYCDIFQLSHSAEKYPKGFFPETRKQLFFLKWKHQKKVNLPLEIFFSNKVFDKKKSHIAEEPKERPFRLMKRFLETESFKKNQGGAI